MPNEKAIEVPKGFTCECGTFHRYGLYVYAHWRDVLVHVCSKCGAMHHIIMGHVTLKKKGKMPKRPRARKR